MPTLPHLLHPVRSTKRIYLRGRRYAYRRLAEHQLRKVQRGHRDHCWCGGDLQPFPWHSSYGVCTECGSYVNKRPPLPAEMSKVYSHNGYWGVASKLRGWPTLRSRADLYKQDGRLDLWLRLVHKYAPVPGNVIEVGCAPGILLAELQQRGYQCVGVEADEKVAAWIQSHRGIVVRAGLFPDPTLQLQTCDFFLAFDVLEHVPAPEEFMRAAASLLCPGGIAIIQAPINRRRQGPPFGNANLFASDPYDEVERLFIFVDDAMVRLGIDAGLKVVSLDETPWRERHELCIYRKPADRN